MSDLINRQAAITAIQNAYCDTEGGEDKCAVWKNVGLTNALYIMQDLPSAQPEQRWIPCSDDNPKADGRYLITGKMGTVYSLDFEDGRWYGGIKPVAWMPLPDCYQGDGNNEM